MLSFRQQFNKYDPDKIKQIASSTGFFDDSTVEISVNLAKDILKPRYKAIPGMEGFAHRLGGLEKDFDSSAISTHPGNHEKMTDTRQTKIDKIAYQIPLLEVTGSPEAKTLVVGWGGTKGHIYSAVEEVNASGKKVAFAHFNYINPLPLNTEEVLKAYDKLSV